jgi:Methyltransferase domain
VDWQTAVTRLARILPGVAEHLQEPALRETEALVERRYAEVEDAAWERRYSADRTLARCLYAICRAARPELVVETGVAYGVSSAFILTALERNGQGELISVDLPPLGGRSQDLVGAVVPDAVRSRWTLRRGTSERELPRIVRGRTVDVFVHDSLHTLRNMRREFDVVWSQLQTGGVIVSDDVEGNAAFLELQARPTRYWGTLRQDGKPSLIGIAVKGD